MNDPDLRLEVVSRSCQPLRYIRRWLSRKPLEIEAWFQSTTNRKWHMDYQMVTWPMTSGDPRRCWEAVRSAIVATAWLLVYHRFCIMYYNSSKHLWCSTACRIVGLHCKLSPTSVMHLILISSRLLSYVAVFTRDSIYTTLCSEKKHPLTFSFISPSVMCRFKQKFQWIYLRNGGFWQCRN